MLFSSLEGRCNLERKSTGQHVFQHVYAGLPTLPPHLAANLAICASWPSISSNGSELSHAAARGTQAAQHTCTSHLSAAFVSMHVDG